MIIAKQGKLEESQFYRTEKTHQLVYLSRNELGQWVEQRSDGAKMIDNTTRVRYLVRVDQIALTDKKELRFVESKLATIA